MGAQYFRCDPAGSKARFPSCRIQIPWNVSKEDIWSEQFVNPRVEVIDPLLSNRRVRHRESGFQCDIGIKDQSHWSRVSRIYFSFIKSITAADIAVTPVTIVSRASG